MRCSSEAPSLRDRVSKKLRLASQLSEYLLVHNASGMQGARGACAALSVCGTRYLGTRYLGKARSYLPAIGRVHPLRRLPVPRCACPQYHMQYQLHAYARLQLSSSLCALVSKQHQD